MSSSPQHRNRSSVLEALRQAASTHACHRALLLLLRAVKFLLAAFLLLCLADILLHFGPGTRSGLSLTLLGTLFLLLLTAFLIALCARPAAQAMAGILEKRHRAFGSKLTNLLELHDQATDSRLSPLTRELAQQAVTDATRDLDTAEIRAQARAPFLKREAKRALLVTAFFLLLPLLLGEAGRRQFLRFLHPHGDHPPLSFTWLEISKPNHDGLEVVYGESTRIEVKAKGHLPEELFLRVQPRDGSRRPREIPLSTRGDGLYLAVLEDVQAPLVLTAHTPNERSLSKQRHLAVLLNPRIEDAQVTITPPAYTGLPAREQPFRFTTLQALQGSTLTFAVQSNRPLGTGELTLTTSEGASDSQELKPLPGGKTSTAVATLTVRESGRFHFALRDEEGRPAEDTAHSSLTVSEDLPPSLSFSQPQEDSFVVENHELLIEVAASDDYGLRTLRLLPAVDDQPLAALSEDFSGVGPRREQFRRTIQLNQLGARPGQVITFFAEAIDNCPDPHLTRTEMRRLEVISEEQYQQFLRRQADVAQIAGAYEQLLDQLHSQLREQERLAEKLEKLAQREAQGELSEAEKKEWNQLQEAQEALNEQLRETARGMEEMAGQTPVYDFEENLHQHLREMAQAITQSAAQNDQDNAAARDARDSAQAAREQLARLGQEQQQGEEAIREPLADLAALHELIKDVNEFKALYEEQKTLAEQTARFENQPELSPADRLSLQEMAGRQREVATRLQDLQEKLRRHAGAAEEDFPKASQSARELADAIGHHNLPPLGRESSQSMLSGKGSQSHAQASDLQQKMESLMSSCSQCQGQGQSELDHYLSLSLDSPPGQNFQQMMDSLCFNPGSQGSSGMGQGGSFATGIMPGQQMGLLGGRSLLLGPIGRTLAGQAGTRGNFGQSGQPLARVESNRAESEQEASSRETQTPESQATLQEYENLTEAYFRALTRTPNPTEP
ncbi:DUF4175 family protein [Roseibacillus ishigakijimensis]|uniref:Uncharacterized protein n=1 Tax=Roseibacillus ishigakijimensis TaxID=454146 RepID=A0A934RRT3_9BACT|nr:DUF4175 family protein [Roseibacillus ishigakijimensis]MBK1833070.1 hypothetical protein [Roseibacillus ishigakijimensis]